MSCFDLYLTLDITDYLVPQARRMQLDDDNWKYLNLQIGSNDLVSAK